MKNILILFLMASALPSAAQDMQRIAPASVQQANPNGTGNPNAVTCRKPQPLPGSRLMAPPVCLINDQWALLRRDGQDISPDGRTRMASEKARTLGASPCQATANTGAGNPKGAGMATGLSFSPVCF